MFQQKKTNEFIQFVKERYVKIHTNFTFSKDAQKIKYVSGEKKYTIQSNLAILDKYINNFLNVRSSDVESLQADKQDRESAGSRSFSHHMKPGMLDEFDRAYTNVSNSLQCDIFESFYDITVLKHVIKLPKILNSGEVNYGDKKKEQKDEIEIDSEPQKVQNPIRIKNSMKDAWDLDDQK